MDKEKTIYESYRKMQKSYFGTIFILLLFFIVRTLVTLISFRLMFFAGVSMVLTMVVNGILIPVELFLIENLQEYHDRGMFAQKVVAMSDIPAFSSIIMHVLICLQSILYGFLLIVPGVKRYFSLIMSYYLMQKEKKGFKDAMKKSKEIMEGHKMECFKTFIFFYLWKFLLYAGLVFTAIFLYKNAAVIRTPEVIAKAKNILLIVMPIGIIQILIVSPWFSHLKVLYFKKLYIFEETHT